MYTLLASNQQLVGRCCYHKPPIQSRSGTQSLMALSRVIGRRAEAQSQISFEDEGYGNLALKRFGLSGCTSEKHI